MIIAPETAVASYVLQISTTGSPGIASKLGAFHVWKKGGRFGSSDEMMKWCPEMGCQGLFTDTFELTEQEMELLGSTPEDFSTWPNELRWKYADWYSLPVMCPVCGVLSIREQLPDTYVFNMGYKRIANRAAQIFQRLGGDADIYLVKTKERGGLHKAQQELQSASHTEKEYKKLLEKGREREYAFYPLKNIIADTAAGADLANRIRALLEA